MARIILTPAAEREYKRLPGDVQIRVRKLFDGSFQADPFNARFNTRKVQEPFTGYRLRLGDYRVLFGFGDGVILVYRIRHRKDAYK
ncbi:type II toxin-antitoxin system RelE/ParE family toxin [Candidatus Kaiserbacteria bacterium]|nr:type II toxin-antitoxin system RelE/ParE family toxin [Candidatus Kaiserbacteria bacterium]